MSFLTFKKILSGEEQTCNTHSHNKTKFDEKATVFLYRNRVNHDGIPVSNRPGFGAH